MGRSYLTNAPLSKFSGLTVVPKSLTLVALVLPEPELTDPHSQPSREEIRSRTVQRSPVPIDPKARSKVDIRPITPSFQQFQVYSNGYGRVTSRDVMKLQDLGS